MRKNTVPRILGLLAVYIVVFFALCLLQWARSDTFTRKAGGITISAKYGRAENGALTRARETPEGEEYDLSGGAKIAFMGLEFLLGDGEDAILYTDKDGGRFPAYPKTLNVSPAYACFKLGGTFGAVAEGGSTGGAVAEGGSTFGAVGGGGLPGGGVGGSAGSPPGGGAGGGGDGAQGAPFIELNFYLQPEGGIEELLISSILPEGVTEITVPFRVLKKSSLLRGDNGQKYISLDDKEWMFDRPVADFTGETFALTAKQPVLMYQRRGGRLYKVLEHIVPGAMEKSRYDELTAVWRNKVYTAWTAQIAAGYGGGVTESLISAWVAEAARRGAFAEALERLPDSFLSSRQSYLSSPFMGRLPLALQSKAEFEKANVERLTALLRSDPAAFLREDKIFAYLAQRGYTNLFDEAVRYVRSIQPGAITMDMLPALFEGWWAWNIWHKTEENPFETLVQQARHTIAGNLKKDGEAGAVFVAAGQDIDVLYNARLGGAVTLYGELSGSGEWAALGRSIALSCMDYSNASGFFPAQLREEKGIITAVQESGLIDPLSVYLLLTVSDYYPHAVGVSTLVRGVWIWTMSPAIAASYTNNVLDFGITFFQGGTHYLMISGVQPFSKIQIRGIDYRSEPQFENWNAPGWVYSPSEQTLLVKLVHNTPTEHIKIFY